MSFLDNCYILDRDDTTTLALRLHSPLSSVTLDVFTNQAALQVYSCNGQDGSLPLKETQGDGAVPKYGCVVLEVQDWIDAINHPEWMRLNEQIFETGGMDYVLEASYHFGVAK